MYKSVLEFCDAVSKPAFKFNRDAVFKSALAAFLLALIFSASFSFAAAVPECKTDANCKSLGTAFKCQPQKTGCAGHESDSTCVIHVCREVHPDNETECKKVGGRWEGTKMGRGRLIGCNLPTTDGGKMCERGEDCQGVCLSNGTCNGWALYKGCARFKGHASLICVD